MTPTETTYYTSSTYQRKFMPVKPMTKKRAIAVMALFAVGAVALLPIAGFLAKAIVSLFLWGWGWL